MRTPSWFPAALCAAGAAALGVGGLILYRRRAARTSGAVNDVFGLGSLGRGTLVEDLAEPAPKISSTTAGGMTLTHYRNKGMSIEQRVRHLQDLTWKSIQDPRMRKIALDITRQCAERDGSCEAKAIYKAVRNRVRYTGDVATIKMGADGPEEGVDFFQSAYRTWEIGGGDCDDNSVLVATLLALNGITPRFRVTAPKKNTDWAHIYVIAGLPKLDPKKWTAVDTTLPGKNKYGVEFPFGKNIDFKIQEFAA